MAELQDYLMSSTSLVDYAPEQLVGSVANEKSKVNLAANVATLSEDPVATFSMVKSELDSGPQSATHNSIMTQIQQQGIKANREFFMDIMLRDDVSDEEKRLMAQQLASDTIPIRSEHDVISEQNLMQPDGVYTEDGFVTREASINIFREANAYRSRVMKLQNANNLFKDQTLLKKAADIGELFIPFLDQSLVAGIKGDLEEEGIDADSSTIGAFFMLGSTKKALAEAFQSMPLQTRTELLTKIEDSIKSNDSLVLDSNAIYLADYLQTILVDGSYTVTDEWIDNVVGLLDIIGLGATIREGVRFGKSAKKASKLGDLPVEPLEPVEGVRFPDENLQPTVKRRPEDIELDSSKGEVDYSDVTARSVQTEVIPISASENIVRNNTSKGRLVHESAIRDRSGQVSRSVSGANSTELAAYNLLPQARKSTGGVEYKLPTPNYIKDEIDRGPNPRTIVSSDTEAGRIYYYNSEKIKEQSLTFNDFENAVGLTSRPNLTSFEARSDGIDIGITYGPTGSGYANANDAVDLVKFHLRDYGIKDENITVLKNTPTGYEPVTYTPNMPIGDYLVQVDYKHRFSAKKGQVTGKKTDTMVEQAPEESIINDLFESFGKWGGGVRSTFLSAEAVLDQRLMAGAFTAIDEAVGLEKKLIDYIKDFSKGYRNLKKVRKQNFVRAIQEANYRGIAYDRVWAQGRWGMTNDEYNLLQQFKNAQDQLYWLENEDFVRTLKNKGYGQWSDQQGTKLIAKPLARNQVKHMRALDPTINQVIDITNDQLTTLYKNGGVVAELRTKFDFNGENVSHIISQESIDKGYFRSLNLDDAVLNYRPGYFKVSYKDPLFVVEELLVNGQPTSRVIATAPDTQAAELFVKRMQQANPNNTYYHRPDLKKQAFDNDDANFDMSVAQGRSSQRYRGLRLADSSQLGQPLSASNIVDPIEAFQHAATGVASRVSMRDYLEAYKVRLMNTYKDVMPMREGQSVFPENVSQIRDRKTGRISKRVRQARAMYRYMDMLEASNGSILGDVTRAGLNSLADVIGQIPGRSGSVVERAIREASSKDPVATAAKMAFLTQIATNPLGQLITQGGGAIISFAKRPKFFLRKGGFMEQTWSTWAHRAGVNISDDALKSMGLSRSEWDEMMFRLEQSGLPYAADANNLVRSGATSMSERDWSAIRGGVVGVPSRTLKLMSLGFDKGEFFNVTSAFLTFADEAREAGKLNNAEDWQAVAAKARNFTFGMNKAGQFGYQSNELRIPLQYFQVVQKMFQLVSFNKSFSKKDKAKLFGAMVAIFGTDGIPGLEQAIDKATEDFAKDPALWEVRKILQDGLLQYGVNAALSLVSGADQSLAIKERISPLDYNSAQTTLREVLGDFSIVELLTESPSGQTFGKIGRTMADGLRLINLTDQHLPNNPTDLATFSKSVATIFSGSTNLFKAKMAWEYGKSFSAGGFVTDQETTSVEAIAKAFGFRTMDEARQFVMSEELYGTSQRDKPSWSSEQDVEEWYKGAKRDIFLSQEDPSGLEMIKMIYGNVGHKLFKDSPQNLLILQKLIDRDAKRGDYQFIDGVLRAVGAGMGETEAKSMINKLPNLSREQKAKYIEMVDNLESLKRGE